MTKVADNDDPDFRARALAIKEQRSELVKHHLWVLWTDYFKPPHFEKYPKLHQLFNEATKLAGAGGTKGSVDPARPTSCSTRSTRSPRSSGRPRPPDGPIDRTPGGGSRFRLPPLGRVLTEPPQTAVRSLFPRVASTPTA